MGDKKDRHSIAEIFQEIYPLPRDLENYIGYTQNIPASSIVTITWTFRETYDIYIRKLYCDATAGCAYLWTLGYIFFGSTGATKELEGNEHEFTRRCILKGGETLTLVIANSSANNYDLDIVIDSWARPLEYKTVEE